MVDDKTPRWIPILFGAVMVAMGLMIAGSLLGFVPTERGAYFGPRWVMWMLSIGLLLAGVLVAGADEVPVAVRTVFGMIAMLLLAGVCNWTAFAPGVHYYSSTSIGPLSFGGEDPIGGRIVFGVVAGLIDALLLGSLVQSVRQRLRRR